MLLLRILGAIWAFCTIGVAFPQQQSVTKVVIETATILAAHQVPYDIAGSVTSLTSATATTSMDNLAVIVSMLAIFTPPASLSIYTDLPSSVSWGLEAVSISGVGGVPAYVSALNAGISMGVSEMPIAEYTWFSSQRDGVYSFLPEILSLGGGVISLDMTSASEMASALSALSASEAYLSTHVFTSVTTALSTTINTAVVISQVARPGSAKKGLSTGEKIGLGIGIPAFMILLLLGGFIIFHVRRNRYLEYENAVFVPPAPHETHSTQSINNNSGVALRPEPDTGLPSSQEMAENIQEQAETGPRTPLPNTRRQTSQPPQRPSSVADIESIAHQQSKPHSQRTLSTGGIPTSSGSKVEEISSKYLQIGDKLGLIRGETAQGNETTTGLLATPIHMSTTPKLPSLELLRAPRKLPAMRPSNLQATNSSTCPLSSSYSGATESGVKGKVRNGAPA